MAEKNNMRFDNIKQAGKIIEDGNIKTFIQKTDKVAVDLKAYKKLLEEKLKSLELARKEKESQEKLVAEEKPLAQEIAPKKESAMVEKEKTIVEEPIKKEQEKPQTEPKKVADKIEEKALDKKEEKPQEPSSEVKEQPAEPPRPSFILRREVPIQRPPRTAGGDRDNKDFKRPQREFRPSDKPFERQQKFEPKKDA